MELELLLVLLELLALESKMHPDRSGFRGARAEGLPAISKIEN